MFHVGQHVVCVDAEVHHLAPWPLCDHDMDGLRSGVVYTIRAVGVFRGLESVWLHEIVRPIRGANAHKYGEAGYSPHRFRPLASTRLDVFRQLLVSPKERVGA